MSDTITTGARLGEAVHSASALSRTGLLERAFSRLFHGLVYAQIWEDPVADMAALGLGPADSIVCIASGGCNAMSYLTASPRALAAVDLSPAHVALLKLKLTAARQLDDHDDFYDLFGRGDLGSNIARFDRRIAPHLDGETRGWWEARTLTGRRADMLAAGLYRQGALGRFIGAVHLLARLHGIDFRPLLAARSLEAQQAFFDARLAPLFDRPLVRALARRRVSLFGLGIPPAQYDKLAADGGGDVIPVLRERVRKLVCDFPVAGNYFAWQAFNRAYAPPGGAVPPYLDAARFAALRAATDRTRVENRSMTEFLRGEPVGSHDCFVLLDAQDWMTDAQLGALWAEITRTARPGARVLFRTGGAADILPGRVPPGLLDLWAYDAEASQTAFAADRSAIYGGVHLYRMRETA